MNLQVISDDISIADSQLKMFGANHDQARALYPSRAAYRRVLGSQLECSRLWSLICRGVTVKRPSFERDTVQEAPAENMNFRIERGGLIFRATDM
jgi:hypothetical protein